MSLSTLDTVDKPEYHHYTSSFAHDTTRKPAEHGDYIWEQCPQHGIAGSQP
jgi:hypothetical protein